MSTFKPYTTENLPRKRGYSKNVNVVFTDEVVNMLVSASRTGEWVAVAERVLPVDAPRQAKNSARASLYSAAQYRKNRYNSNLEFAVRQKTRSTVDSKELVVTLFARLNVDPYDFGNQ